MFVTMMLSNAAVALTKDVVVLDEVVRIVAGHHVNLLLKRLNLTLVVLQKPQK